MKALRFPEAAAVALMLAVVTGIAHFSLGLVVSSYEALAGAVLGMGFLYSSYLIARSPRKDGRVLVAVLWLLSTVLMAAIGSEPLLLVLQQVVMFWLIRCLCYHRRFAWVCLDVLIGGFSIAAMLWAFAASASVTLAVWTLLLCQSLFTFITKANHRPDGELSAEQAGQCFERAHRSASHALQRVVRDSAG